MISITNDASARFYIWIKGTLKRAHRNLHNQHNWYRQSNQKGNWCPVQFHRSVLCFNGHQMRRVQRRKFTNWLFVSRNSLAEYVLKYQICRSANLKVFMIEISIRNITVVFILPTICRIPTTITRNWIECIYVCGCVANGGSWWSQRNRVNRLKSSAVTTYLAYISISI